MYARTTAFTDILGQNLDAENVLAAEQQSHSRNSPDPLKVDTRDLFCNSENMARPGTFPTLCTPLTSYEPLFFLEIFAGSGRLTSAMSSLGMTCLPPVDICNGHEFDLCRPSTQRLLMRLVQQGKIWYIHCGLPCTHWSQA